MSIMTRLPQLQNQYNFSYMFLKVFNLKGELMVFKFHFIIYMYLESRKLSNTIHYYCCKSVISLNLVLNARLVLIKMDGHEHYNNTMDIQRGNSRRGLEVGVKWFCSTLWA